MYTHTHQPSTHHKHQPSTHHKHQHTTHHKHQHTTHHLCHCITLCLLINILCDIGLCLSLRFLNPEGGGCQLFVGLSGHVVILNPTCLVTIAPQKWFLSFGLLNNNQYLFRLFAYNGLVHTVHGQAAQPLTQDEIHMVHVGL